MKKENLVEEYFKFKTYFNQNGYNIPTDVTLGVKLPKSFVSSNVVLIDKEYHKQYLRRKRGKIGAFIDIYIVNRNKSSKTDDFLAIYSDIVKEKYFNMKKYKVIKTEFGAKIYILPLNEELDFLVINLDPFKVVKRKEIKKILDFTLNLEER